MKPTDAVKFFGLNNLSIESEMRRIEIEQDVELGHRKTKRADEHYFPQFRINCGRKLKLKLRQRNSIFYCLENCIRSLIYERLTGAFGTY
jgi:hypothetical protein